MQAARHTSFKELGIKWHYWLVPAGFCAAGIGAFYAINVEPEGRNTFIICGTFFLVISILAFLWPILRIMEKAGAKVTSLRSTSGEYRGLFIPMSKVKSRITIVGGSLMGAGALLAVLFSGNPEYQVKGGLAFAVYIGLGGPWIYRYLKYEPGMLFTKNGILWHDPSLSPCLILWENVMFWGIYDHREKYSNPPSIGVILSDAGLADMSKSTRQKLDENRRRFGIHFYYHGESLLVPLAKLTAIGDYYRQYPESRDELTCETALMRLGDGAAINNQIQPV
jgi:hypothetical protein